MNKDRKLARVTTFIFLGMAVVSVVLTIYIANIYFQESPVEGIEDFSDGFEAIVRTDGGVVGAGTETIPDSSREIVSGDDVDFTHIREYSEISKRLGDVSDGDAICINAKSVNLAVYLDDVLVYQTETPHTRFFGKTPGNYYVSIPLTQASSGKTLRITFDVPYNDNSGKIYSIRYGKADVCLKSCLLKKLPAFISSVLYTFLGLFFLFLFLPLRKSGIRRNELLYLGLLSLHIGIFMMADSGFLQLTLGHAGFFHMIAEVWMILVAPPMVLYLEEQYHGIGRRHIIAINILAILNFLVCVGLSLAGIKDLHQTVRVTHIVYILTIIIIIRSIFKLVSRKERGYGMHFFGIICICTGVIIDVVMLNVGVLHETTFFTRFGMLIFLCLEGAQVMTNLISWYQNLTKQELIHQLAYKDGLTGLLNRTSYEEALQKLRDEDKLPVEVAFFDINNLKRVNDGYGHAAGDDLITIVSSAIEKIFGPLGDCYRVGGDEFVFIKSEGETDNLRALQEQLNKILYSSRLQQDESFPIGVAMGYVYRDVKSMASVDDMIADSDQFMYENKREDSRRIVQ